MNSPRNLGLLAPGMNHSLHMPNDWTTPRVNPRRRGIQRISGGHQTTPAGVVYPSVQPQLLNLNWQHWNDPLIMQQTHLPIAPVTVVEVRSIVF